MKVSFPAMQGTIGQRTYYSCLMKLNAIPKMFTFRDWVEFTPEDREQRILNKKRIPEIAKYILDNEDGYLFSSITASYKCDADVQARRRHEHRLPRDGVRGREFRHQRWPAPLRGDRTGHQGEPRARRGGDLGPALPV